MQFLKSAYNKTKNFVKDRYNLLFKGAAVNHLRIQDALRNSDGTYQLTIKFNSYTELKRYQKKLRRVTVSLSSAVAMIIVAVIASPYVMNPNKSSASTFLFKQIKWTTQDSNYANTANYPSDNSGFVKYNSKSSSIQITADASNSITMVTPSANSAGENATAIGSTHTVFVAGNMSDTMYKDVSGNLALKKLFGAACSLSGECAASAGSSCNDGTCGDWWNTSYCGVLVEKSVSTYSSDYTLAVSRCTSLGARLPTVSESSCLNANDIRFRLTAGAYWISGYGGCNAVYGPYGTLQGSSGGFFGPYCQSKTYTARSRCVK